MASYLCIDLKSFYASVECADRGLDPLNTNLVVADASRTDKTICLAVSPSLKAVGVPGRPRLFEVIAQVDAVNRKRLRQTPYGEFCGESVFADALAHDPEKRLTYIIAPPRMARYMEVSTQIYEIYLRFIAPEDIHVYSVDEVFIDVTAYLNAYRCTPHELAMRMVREVLRETGITATAGIGTNLYLAKVAMDIVAKKMPPDKDGVRIAALDEMSYRKTLWTHTPITDFWRVGAGTARRLAAMQLYTMGDIAETSELAEEKLYRMFGVNAELLIDHAWGWEPCTIDMIKAYRPENHSLSQGQVLPRAYTAAEGRIICREMADQLVLDLVRQQVVADQIVLTVGYDHTGIPIDYAGTLTADHYGKRLPRPVHGSVNLGRQTASQRLITEAAVRLYDRIIDPELMVRRLCIAANHVISERDAKPPEPVQYSLFDDVEQLEREQAAAEEFLDREKHLQQAVLYIKERFGKNAILRGTNFQEGATAIERNGQVGGHRA